MGRCGREDMRNFLSILFFNLEGTPAPESENEGEIVGLRGGPGRVTWGRCEDCEITLKSHTLEIQSYILSRTVVVLGFSCHI